MSASTMPHTHLLLLLWAPALLLLHLLPPHSFTPASNQPSMTMSVHIQIADAVHEGSRVTIRQQQLPSAHPAKAAPNQTRPTANLHAAFACSNGKAVEQSARATPPFHYQQDRTALNGTAQTCRQVLCCCSTSGSVTLYSLPLAAECPEDLGLLFNSNCHFVPINFQSASRQYKSTKQLPTR